MIARDRDLTIAIGRADKIMTTDGMTVPDALTTVPARIGMGTKARKRTAHTACGGTNPVNAPVGGKNVGSAETWVTSKDP